MFLKILLIIILIIGIPQIYYRKKSFDYKSLNNGVKFFVRTREILDDHEEIYLTNTDGHDIFVRIYEVENPKAIIQIVHGMAEHSSNYIHFIKFLISQGYTVVAHDHRGHGRSISEKYKNGYMSISDELIDDTYAVNRYMKLNHENLKIYMVGHSMGSMIARVYLQEHDETIDKLVLSGTVACSKIAWFGYAIANIVSFYFGEYRKSMLTSFLPGKDGDISWISYDKNNVYEKENDPQRVYNFLERGVAVIIDLNKKMSEYNKFEGQNRDLPILSVTGVDDIVTNSDEGLADTFDKLKKAGYHDFENIVYDGMKHEVLNEASNALVYGDIIDFFEN